MKNYKKKYKCYNKNNNLLRGLIQLNKSNRRFMIAKIETIIETYSQLKLNI